MSEPLASLFLSGSSNGAPIQINATAIGSCTRLHYTDDTTLGTPSYQDAVFIKLHNRDNTDVDVVVAWNPVGTSSFDWSRYTAHYTVPAHEDLWIASGERVGWSHLATGNAQACICAYLPNGASDTEKVTAYGWVNRINTSGIIT